MQTNLYSPTDSAKAIETSTPIREVLDKMIARQSILNISSGSFIKDSTIRVLLKKTEASFSLFGHSERHQGCKIKTSGHQDLKISAATLDC
jgi:hypothetical protein